MGGKNTHTVEKHYVQDPAILQQLQKSQDQIIKLYNLVMDLEERLKEAKQLGMKFKDPKRYKQLKQQAFAFFVDNLQKITFNEKIPKKAGERHHVLIGNISSGKSSLINYACGTKLAVGVGQTTNQVRKVACSPDQKVHVWDSPGVNEDFAFYDIEVLSYFHSADRIFILYPDSLKSCKDMVRVLAKIKPSNTYLIRSQCDRWEKGMNKTIVQQLETDKQLLNEWGIKIPILATSSKKNDEFMDNKRFKILLSGQQ